MVMEGRRQVTQETIASVARRLYRLRPLLTLLAIGAGAWFAWELLATAGDSARALLALTVLLWALLSLGMAHAFSRYPEPVAAGDRLLRRLRQRVLGICYWIGVAGFVGLLATAVGLTLRAMGLFLDQP